MKTGIVNTGRHLLAHFGAGQNVLVDGYVLPRAFDDQVMLNIWRGRFGADRLIAHVADDGVKGLYVKKTPTGDVFHRSVRGTILTDRGEVAGEFVRSFSLDRPGHLTAHHDILVINENVNGARYRNRGFATQFNSHAIEQYRKLGVHSVELSAAGDGAVVWAKRGFELLPDVRETKLHELVDKATQQKRISMSESQTLHRAISSSGDDAIAGVRELVAVGELGERVLRGSSWRGQLLL